MGRSSARGADPHRARARDRRACRDHRPYHRHRAAPLRLSDRDRQRAAEPFPAPVSQTRQAAPRRRRPEPAQRHRPRALPRDHAQHARGAGQVKLAADTRELWWHTYPQLTQPADGLTGQLTARAEAHTIRLALIYALLDTANTIRPEHLTAALALWDYAARSAAWAINHSTGDLLAEQIHTALARSPDGLTRTQIRDLCQRNLPAERVEQALTVLAAAGRAQQQRTITGGRPAELWTPARAPVT